MGLNPITTEELGDAPGAVIHGFFTRAGGCSDGIYASLNVGIGSDDEQGNIIENRRRVAEAMGVDEDNLLTVFQVHSPEVVVVKDGWSHDDRPQADAMVTNQPGLAIGVLTADCGPVLFMDAEAQVVGAAHAGWKSATGGVLENTVTKMESLGATRSNIRAMLGPTISADSYEVGPEFVDRLILLDSENEQFFSSSNNADHAMFDLPGYIVKRLRSFGVKAGWTGECTYKDKDRFFSYRRKTHRDEPDYGRQISVISINNN